MMEINALLRRASCGEKIAMLTCYDATFAKLMEEVGVDVLLVGDSLGMVVQGAENTLRVDMNQMLYHTQCVSAGVKHTPIMADMPIGSYEHELVTAFENAQRLIDAGASIVKIEGGGKRIDTARYLVERGIPVCAHLGFTPQAIHQIGGYKIQGKTTDEAKQLLDDAIAMNEAGVSMVVLEMVPATLAKTITQSLSIPTIGIGAGVDCSGQVLVVYDMLGIYSGVATKDPAQFKSPRFVRNFLNDGSSIRDALSAYVTAVKQQTFPTTEHSY